jgi:hypothetical protein
MGEDLAQAEGDGTKLYNTTWSYAVRCLHDVAMIAFT